MGCNGRIPDGGVFKNCSLYHVEKHLNIPKETMLPGTKLNFPFVVVADDTFPLKEYIVKPYSQTDLTRERRIFNYHLRCARRAVENPFGILAKVSCFHDPNECDTGKG